METRTGSLIEEGNEFLVDGIRALAIKSLDEDGGTKLFECVKKLLAMKPDDWPSEVKEGWIIPLHKKGPKTDLNNYRGVCFLPLASRLIARVYATRLRTWAEKTEALGENQCSFRRGRSTADSTQIILKVDEEVRRVYGRRTEDELVLHC